MFLFCCDYYLNDTPKLWLSDLRYQWPRKDVIYAYLDRRKWWNVSLLPWEWKVVNLPKEVQKCWWAWSVFVHRLFLISQIRTVLSSLAVNMYLPPGWKVMPRTQLSWPANVNKHKPELTSQICWERNHFSLKSPLNISCSICDSPE